MKIKCGGTIKDVVYYEADEVKLCLDLYLPENSTEKKSPCAVFFHGGGWREGGKEDICWFPLIVEKLTENGFVVASAQYRLFGKNGGGFPQSVEDSIRALKFLDNASPVIIDADRKGVFGISAGGYMALMCVLYQQVCEIKSNVKAIVDMCGPSYMQGSLYSFDNPETVNGFIRDFIGAYKGDACNPLSLLKNAQMKPALMIVHGEYDECVDPDNSRELYKQARQYGWNAEYTEVKNAYHTFNAAAGTRIKPSMHELSDMMSEFIIKNV